MRKGDATKAPSPLRKPAAPTPAEGFKPKPPTRARRIGRLVLIALGILTAAVVVVNITGVLRLVVVPRVERMLGCRVSSGRAVITTAGELVVKDLAFDARDTDLSPKAARFLQADELRISIDWSELFKGHIELKRIALLRPVIRFSQGPEQALNIKSVVDTLAKSSSGATIQRLPTIDIMDATFELGEHTGGQGARYDELTSLRLKGSVSPDRGDPGRYTISFIEEKGPRPKDTSGPSALTAAKTPGLSSPIMSPPMKLDGFIDLVGNASEVRLTNVDLADWGRRTAPTNVRDLWRQMNVGGTIPQVTLSYEPKRGLSASFDLANVDLSIPIPVEADWDSEGEPVPGAVMEKKPLPMRDVTGRIRFDSLGLDAELTGNVVDLPCTVRLKTQGLKTNSALVCDIESRGFQIQKRPRLLPFAPPFVRMLFQRFTSPTAEAEGVVKLSRAAALISGDPAPLKVAGSIKFKNGTARHEMFSYPVSQLSGIVNFDDEKVELLNIKGANPNGAKLLASGVIAPPDDSAAADVKITVIDVPIDELFLEALPENRRGIYRALFDHDAYARLRSDGLVQSSADEEQRRKAWNQVQTDLALAERGAGGNGAGGSGGFSAERIEALRADETRLQEELKIPVFDLGGIAQMEISVTRELGVETFTHADVRLTSAKAGLVMAAFPLPVIAEDVDLQLGAKLTTMKPVKVSSIGGAFGTLTGRVEYPPDGPLNPQLEIIARNLPVDELLVRALPGGPGSRRTPPGVVSASSLVGAMHFTGAVNGVVRLMPDLLDPSHEGVLFNADIEALNLSARPGSGRLPVSELFGALTINDEGVQVHSMQGLAAGAPFELSAHASYSPQRGTDVTGRFTSRGLDLAETIEDLIAPAAPDAGAKVAELRHEHDPSGCVDGELMFWQSSGDHDGNNASGSASLTVSNGQAVAFLAAGNRVDLATVRGGMGVDATRIAFVDCELEAAPTAEAREPARVRLDGDLAMDDRTPTRLSLNARNARFESGLVRAFAVGAGDEVRTFVEDSNPAGEFDARIIHERNTPDPGAAQTTGEIEPRSLMFTRRGVPIHLDPISGKLSFGPTGGRLDHLHAKAANWSVDADGEWVAAPQSSLDLVLSMEGDAIPPDLRAALPLAAAEAIDAVELGETGSFSMKGAHIKLEPTGTAVFNGDVDLSGITLQPVVKISEASGRVTVDAGRTTEGKSVGVEVNIAADSFRLAGVRMTSGRAKLLADPATGAVSIPMFEARAHGGRLTAHGVIGPQTSAKNAKRSFDLSADLGNVRFGDFLADLYPKSALDESQGKPAVQVNRGTLDGSFSVAGVLGDVNSRRGRGLLRVQDGEVLNMPAVVPILKLSNLQAPVEEKVGFGYADFYIQGDKLLFNDFTLQSKSLAIEGRGAITWPGLEVAMNFVTRSLSRVPLLSDLIEGVRDELVTTEVSGTLYDPQLKYKQLTSTKKMLGELFGEKKKHEPPPPSSDEPARPPENPGTPR